MGDLFGNSSGGNSGGQTTLLVVVALCCCSSLLVALFLWYAYNNQSSFSWLNWFFSWFGGGTSSPSGDPCSTTCPDGSTTTSDCGATCPTACPDGLTYTVPCPAQCADGTYTNPCPGPGDPAQTGSPVQTGNPVQTGGPVQTGSPGLGNTVKSLNCYNKKTVKNTKYPIGTYQVGNKCGQTCAPGTKYLGHPTYSCSGNPSATLVTETHKTALLYSLKDKHAKTSKPVHINHPKARVKTLVKIPAKTPTKTPAAKKPANAVKIGTMHTISHFAPLPSNEVDLVV